ncbi:MAG: acyltransferase [Acidobacteriota bacterium]|nr:MAG: acyltransferase [Acidobacteriota bacterium]
MNERTYTRRYDLDWLRVLAFTLLILYHTGMMFNGWSWHVKNPETSKILEYVMRFSNQWRMPLLFFISGAAVWFAMEKYKSGRFAWERIKRLLIPLTFGMFFIIPPQVYFERLFQGESFGSFWVFYESVLHLHPYPEGNFSWHHLWYIPYILVYSLLMLPFFSLLKHPTGRKWLTRFMQKVSQGSGVIWWFVPIALSQILLRPYWPDDTHNLIADWAQFAGMLLVFCLGFVFASSDAIWRSLESLRRLSLGLGVGTISILYCVWYAGLRPPYLAEPAYWILSSANIWFWILAILGYGYRYLRFRNRLLTYSNEAVYPFYILHQTITVIVGYHMVHWNAPILVKFVLLALATFAGSWVIYAGLIRRLPWLRPLFGLKFHGYRPAGKRPLSRGLTFSTEGAE